MKNMETYSKCIVAFLDILGFKNMINTKAFEEIREIFSNVIPQSDFCLALGRVAYDDDKVLNQYNDVLSKTKMHIMSDSIIIAAPVGYPEALAVVIDICDVIQEQLYDLEVPVFLRGAIAEGDFYLDEQLIFGKGLVDAYVAQENYAVYPRIIVSDAVVRGKTVSVDSEWKKLPRDKDGYFYINTLERYFQCKTLDEFVTNGQVKKITQCVDSRLQGYADSHLRDKYIWIRQELERIKHNLAFDNNIVMI